MGNENDEPKDLSADFLSSSEIDNALIRLKIKEIEVQIQGHKVLEGLLKDINGELGYLREAIERK